MSDPARAVFDAWWPTTGIAAEHKAAAWAAFGGAWITQEHEIDRLTRAALLDDAAIEEVQAENSRLRAALLEHTECSMGIHAREALADKLDEDDSVKKHNEMRVKMGLAPILLAPQPTITQGESLPLEITEYTPLDE